MVLSIDKSNLPNRIFTVYGRTVTVRMPYRDRLKHQKIRPYAYGRQPLRYGAQPYPVAVVVPETREALETRHHGEWFLGDKYAQREICLVANAKFPGRPKF